MKALPQRDLLQRIEGVVRRTIESRRNDSDMIEWSIALVPVYSEEACTDCGGTDFEFVVGFVARVYCPETDITMVSNLLNQIGRTDQDVADWVNHWWDNLTVERMADAMDQDAVAEQEDVSADTPEEGPGVDHLNR